MSKRIKTDSSIKYIQEDFQKYGSEFLDVLELVPMEKEDQDITIRQCIYCENNDTHGILHRVCKEANSKYDKNIIYVICQYCYYTKYQ